MKKIMAVLLALAMLLTMSIGACAYSINKDDAEIGADDIFGATAVYFADAEVEKNGEVTVELIIESNPGITDLDVTFTLPAGISIKSVAAGDMGTASVNGNVVSVTADTAFGADGCVAKVTFTATEEGDKTIALTATAKNGEEDITVSGSECVIVVKAAAVTVTIGDVDGDGEVNTTDLAALKLHLAGTLEEVEAGADLNDDGSVDTSDLAALKILLAGA